VNGACKIINIKIARVGGFIESQKIAQLCHSNPAWHSWCGGMLESGIGRIINVILQAMPGFTLPGDTSGSNRYFKEDIIDPPVIVNDGFITPPTSKGLGVDLRMDLIEKYTQKSELFK
jgi:O-succinylbenzoate synthase